MSPVFPVLRRLVYLLTSLTILLGLPGSAKPLFATPLYGRDGAPAVAAPAGRPPAAPRIVAIPQLPIHLWQWNPAPGAFYSPMGCGAFSTAMALSTYAAGRFGSYAAARQLYAAMDQIPILGGTPESANAAAARQAGFAADAFASGTLLDLLSLIDRGAPVILLVDPTFLGLGRHDVVLVGYRLDVRGAVDRVYADNPAIGAPDGADGESPGAPGNQMVTLPDLARTWTGTFTPVFRTGEDEQHWRVAAGR